jgi:hypothetical protein
MVRRLEKVHRYAVKDVGFLVDTGASRTMLGTDAVLSLRLKRWQAGGIQASGDYKGRQSSDFLVPGYLWFRHQRPLHSPFRNTSSYATVFGLNFLVPPEAFSDPQDTKGSVGTEEDIDSLLGQDILPLLRRAGEKQTKGWDVTWEFYDAKPNARYGAGGYQAGLAKVGVYYLPGYLGPRDFKGQDVAPTK